MSWSISGSLTCYAKHKAKVKSSEGILHLKVNCHIKPAVNFTKTYDLLATCSFITPEEKVVDAFFLCVMHGNKCLDTLTVPCSTQL